MRIKDGANDWRKEEVVMGDRRISRKRKGNVLSSCITPASMNVQGTMTLTYIQQEKVKVSGNNLISGIMGVEREHIREV